MSDHESKHGSHDEHGHGTVGHVVPPWVLYINTVALLILTVITVAVAEIDFTAYNIYELNIVVAMLVAATKAALVCLFFMHLYWDRPFNSFVLVSSIAFVALFMGLAMLDTSEYAQDLIPGDVQRAIDRLTELDQ